MIRIQAYRQNAARCKAAAERSGSPEEREQLIKMACMYQSLADSESAMARQELRAIA
jgi:hypothetical protein